MSSRIETLNRGEVGNFGFVFDNTRVRLGDDLPAMSIPQFCSYASEILVQTLKSTDPLTKGKILKVFESTQHSLDNKHAVEFQPPQAFLEDPEGVVEIPVALIQSSKETEERTLELPANVWTRVMEADHENEDKRHELGRRLAAALSESMGAQIRDFEENPFVAKDSNIVIADMYEVEPFEFAYFAGHIMRGGFSGWKEVPTCALEGIRAVMNALSSNS